MKSEPVVVKTEPVIVKTEPIRETIIAESKPTDYGTIQDTDKQTIIKNNQIVVVNSPKSTKNYSALKIVAVILTILGFLLFFYRIRFL